MPTPTPLFNDCGLNQFLSLEDILRQLVVVGDDGQYYLSIYGGSGTSVGTVCCTVNLVAGDNWIDLASYGVSGVPMHVTCWHDINGYQSIITDGLIVQKKAAPSREINLYCSTPLQAVTVNVLMYDCPV